MANAVLVSLLAFSGCARKTTSFDALELSVAPIDQARAAYEQGEYYKSRMQVKKILSADPDDTAAQQLMADVLDKEISRQKEELLAGQSQSEDEEKESDSIEAKNWIERSRALLAAKQYDLALFAAEKVFIYDAANLEASLLIDDIKQEAIQAGKSDTLFLSKMYQEEIADRVNKYRGEAEEMIRNQKDQQAKFTLQKILLLEPEDPEALKLFKELQKKEAA